MLKYLAVAALCLAVAPGASAQTRATTKEAEAMVHKAVDYVKAHGKDKAFEAFNDPKGPFTFNDLYIFVYSMDGVVLSTGSQTFKVNIGKNHADKQDADGKYYVRERLQIAKDKGKGWQEFKFNNPATGKTETKVAYLEVVDGVIIGCGAYKQ